MQIKDKVVVVTGAANGIGRALALRFKAEGARAIVVADIDTAGVQALAEEIDGIAVTCNVAVEEDVQHLVRTVESRCKFIDLFCANAGVLIPGGVDTPMATW